MSHLRMFCIDAFHQKWRNLLKTSWSFQPWLINHTASILKCKLTGDELKNACEREPLAFAQHEDLVNEGDQGEDHKHAGQHSEGLDRTQVVCARDTTGRYRVHVKVQGAFITSRRKENNSCHGMWWGEGW